MLSILVDVITITFSVLVVVILVDYVKKKDM